MGVETVEGYTDWLLLDPTQHMDAVSTETLPKLWPEGGETCPSALPLRRAAYPNSLGSISAPILDISIVKQSQ